MGRYKKHEWSAKKQQILLLYEKGKQHQEIADEIGMSRSQVTRIINSERFVTRREKFEENIQKAVLEVFIQNARSAANKIVSIAKKGEIKHRVQFEAAREVLYQVGCRPKTVIEETIKKEYSLRVPGEILVICHIDH
mgnify:CR=1 FL=1